MTPVLEKPSIQCRYRNAEGWQCSLDALEEKSTASSTCPRSGGEPWRSNPPTQPAEAKTPDDETSFSPPPTQCAPAGPRRRAGVGPGPSPAREPAAAGLAGAVDREHRDSARRAAIPELERRRQSPVPDRRPSGSHRAAPPASPGRPVAPVSSHGDDTRFSSHRTAGGATDIFPRHVIVIVRNTERYFGRERAGMMIIRPITAAIGVASPEAIPSRPDLRVDERCMNCAGGNHLDDHDPIADESRNRPPSATPDHRTVPSPLRTHRLHDAVPKMRQRTDLHGETGTGRR